jgi:release factor glutamine methyltransferase
MLATDVRWAAEALVVATGADAPTAWRDAELLARHVLGWDAAEWLTRQREPAPNGFTRMFGALMARRQSHEPIAYITGTREFYGRDFRVTRDVLIPRPETELVVDEALARLPAPTTDRVVRLAEVGTGSGCLAITLALERGDAEVVATDVSAAALAVARRNADRLGAGPRIDFREASLVDGAVSSFDVVVSNPPYVPERDRLTLDADVRDYEPAGALFSGHDGLETIRDLIPAAARALTPGGWLIMELGAGQAHDVVRLAERRGYTAIRVAPDLAGIPRVLVARTRGTSV